MVWWVLLEWLVPPAWLVVLVRLGLQVKVVYLAARGTQARLEPLALPVLEAGLVIPVIRARQATPAS